MFKLMRYRIRPTKRQIETLERQLALCCELYNAALQERRDAWKLNRESVNFYSQSKQLPEIKKLRPDLAEVNSNAVEDVLKRVDKAFKAFFHRVKAGQKPGFPRFRSARRYDSLTLRRDSVTPHGNKLRISKVGQVRIKLHRPVEGKIKELHIKRECGKWYAVFCVEYEPQPLPESAARVGLDMGLTAFATLDDGTEIENPRWFRAAEAKLRCVQRRVARRKRGSNRRRKAVALLQRVYAHVKGQRADFHHKVSRWLVDNHGLIAVENLNVKGLAASKLAKSVHDAGWSLFIEKLTYKAVEAGRALMKVDPRGTSQRCPCGAAVPKELSQRRHKCEACGLDVGRDHASAMEILRLGLSLQTPT